MRKALKLGLFLCLVAGIAGLAIAYVHDLTQPLIDQQLLDEKLNSFQDVYPGAETISNENEKYLSPDGASLIAEINVIYENEKPLGVIYLLEPNGYNGKIQLLAGFDLIKKQITAVKILNQSETPGLGDNVKQSFFTNRFRDKNLTCDLEVVTQEPVAENQILAITSATITSQAVTNAVNIAKQHFLDNFVKQN